MILKFRPRWLRKQPLNLSSLKIRPVYFISNFQHPASEAANKFSTSYVYSTPGLSGFWDQSQVNYAIYLTLISKSAQARCGVNIACGKFIKNENVVPYKQSVEQFVCVGLGFICYLSCLDSCLQTYVLRKIKTERFMLCLSINITRSETWNNQVLPFASLLTPCWSVLVFWNIHLGTHFKLK